MMYLYNYINFIRIIVFISFFYSLIKLNWRNSIYLNLIVILFVGFLTEICTILLNIANYEGKINLLYSISFIFHHLLWLLLITSFLEFAKWKNYIIFLFIILSVVNFLFYEKTGLNYLTFISGALLYIIIFIYGSFKELKKDNFSLFYSNNYVLLFSPILFLLGFSFMFGFRDSNIRNYLVFNKIELYSFISDFVNVIYYTFIIVYIYKESKIKNGA